MASIKDYMSKKVLTVSVKDSIMKAAKIMTARKVSSLVIVKEKTVKGIITRRDILEKVLIKKKDPEKTKIKDVMTFPVMTAGLNSDPMDDINLMNKKRIKQLPVVKNKKLVGIVTQTDLIRNVQKIIKTQIDKTTTRITAIEKKLT